jgi:hypothetical protein
MINMKKWIKISTWLSAVFLIGGLVSGSAYYLIGQEVDAQGFLHEAFALIPLTYLFAALAVLLGGVSVIARLVQRGRAAQEV